MRSRLFDMFVDGSELSPSERFCVMYIEYFAVFLAKSPTDRIIVTQQFVFSIVKIRLHSQNSISIGIIHRLEWVSSKHLMNMLGWAMRGA